MSNGCFILANIQETAFKYGEHMKTKMSAKSINH